jgi:hypothetical protein
MIVALSFTGVIFVIRRRPGTFLCKQNQSIRSFSSQSKFRETPQSVWSVCLSLAKNEERR